MRFTSIGNLGKGYQKVGLIAVSKKEEGQIFQDRVISQGSFRSLKTSRRPKNKRLERGRGGMGSSHLPGLSEGRGREEIGNRKWKPKTKPRKEVKGEKESNNCRKKSNESRKVIK